MRGPRSPRLWIVLAAVVGATVVVAVIALRARDHDDGKTPTRPESAPTVTQPSAVPRASIARLPLRGVPLELDTGLRLLVADAPEPFLLDVDRGTVQRITGLPTRGRRAVSVVAVGDDALILSSRLCRRCLSTSMFLLRQGSTAATRLGTAFGVIPARDGQGLWVLRRVPGRNCLLREVTLGGERRGAPLLTSCRIGLVGDLPAGLLTTFVGPLGRNAHAELLRHDGEEIRLADETAQPVVGNLLLDGLYRQTRLVLRDVTTGAAQRLRWPARHGYSAAGQVNGQLHGPLATIGFAKYSPVDRYDVWLLDTATGDWQQLPDMPTHAIPKTTDMQWTPNGRVVVLTENALGVWRPGDAHLAVRRVPAPKQAGNQFVVW